MKTLIMTQFEVGRIASGHDMVVADLDGNEFNVRAHCLDPEAQHNQRNLPQITLGFDQFRTIATGHSAYGFVEDPGPDFGRSKDYIEQVEIRLPTLAEYRAALVRYKKWFDDNGLTHPGFPEDEAILPLITPIEL